MTSFYWDHATNRYYSTCYEETKLQPLTNEPLQKQPESPIPPEQPEIIESQPNQHIVKPNQETKLELIEKVFEQLRRSTLRCEKPIVIVDNVTPHNVYLSWGDIFNAKSYSIYQKTKESKWHLSNPSSVETNSVEVLDLDPCRTYDFKIKPIPFNAENESLISDPVTVTTKADGGIAYFAVINIADTWSEIELVPLKNTTKNEVLFKSELDHDWSSKMYPSQQRLIRLDNLLPSTSYQLKILAHGDGIYPESNIISFTTESKFNKSTSINGNILDESRIELLIEEVPEATSYIIEMNEGNGWVELAECIGTSYINTSGIVGETYSFRATPVMGNVRGKTSGLIQMFLPSGCVDVHNLKAESGDGFITLNWTGAPGHTYAAQLLTGSTWTTIGNPVASPFKYIPGNKGVFSFRVSANCKTCTPSNISISRI
jgi:hypothetical protein